ncbi:MAG: ABC transporter ATP-binding protein [Desulfovibrio sp.]|uniref:ABC transporter ATP-binding protein n=1 Tax=Desulfovibrio sp. TaxID=885 RepID=UPI0039E65EB6
MEEMVCCRALRHSYHGTEVLHGIDFSVRRGEVVGLLGKNGAGKSTSINILMGFMQPDSGLCSVMGHPSHSIPPQVRARIGLLHEGFTQYNFMTIAEIERFYAAFYPQWDSTVYYDLVNRMGVPANRRITRLSCGQRSQVTLGLIFAQQAELMILDDYSLGLDVGYRRLFLEFLQDHVRRRGTTVLLTSHVVQELENLLDSLVIIHKGAVLANERYDNFMHSFFCYRVPLSQAGEALQDNDGPLLRVERGVDHLMLYSRAMPEEMRFFLESRGVNNLDGPPAPVPMSFEDAFVGLTGRY